MRKLLTTAFLIFGAVSCQPPATELGSSRASSNALAPSYWANPSAAFPLNVRLSSDFASNEIDSIRTSANAWSSAVGNKETFFNTTTTTTEKGGDLGSYNDGLMGVYKLNTWPSDLPGSALAVTQIFGIRKNIGSTSEAIEISHADILVNYANFSFSTDGGSGYDLETVVLHEFGHFLGLGHDSSSTTESVMYPTISRFSQNRSPRSNDQSNIENLYQINGGGATASRAIANSNSADNNLPSELVVIQFEINADGSERVKVNNKYIKYNKCKH